MFCMIHSLILYGVQSLCCAYATCVLLCVVWCNSTDDSSAEEPDTSGESLVRRAQV